MKFIAERGVDIAAIIIEPIQGEGGDNHFRGEWLQKLREICDENEMLLIFDEVQTGMGTTGRNWCCEHFGVQPDLMAFGKKVQVCGVMAGPRLDEVKDNAFRLPSRLELDLGRKFHRHGALDPFPAHHRKREPGRERARWWATHFLKSLHTNCSGISDHDRGARSRSCSSPSICPIRKRAMNSGRACSIDGVLALKSGEHAIRFRPALDITAEAIDEAMDLLRKQCQRMQR